MEIDHLPAAPGVYRITCQQCERVYVGKANNLRTRYPNPKPGFEWHGNRHIDACSVAGHKHVIDVLELCATPEEALKREGYWMDCLDSYAKNGGYNIAEHDPYGNVYFSEESKKKLSQTLRTDPKVNVKLRETGRESRRNGQCLQNMAAGIGGNPSSFDMRPTPFHTAVKWGFGSFAAYRAADNAKWLWRVAKQRGDDPATLRRLRDALNAANRNRPPKHLRPKRIEDLADFDPNKLAFYLEDLA